MPRHRRKSYPAYKSWFHLAYPACNVVEGLIIIASVLEVICGHDPLALD